MARPGLEAAFAAAQSLQQAGRLAEAERAWRELANRAPDHAGVLANLCMVLWQLGRLDDAEAAAERALARDPGMIQAQAVYGACAEARGAIDLAIDRYRRALELKPDLATVLHGLANLHRRKGELAPARDYAERMTKTVPLAAQAWDTLGAIRLAQDDLTGAEAALAEACRLDPTLAGARANLGALAAERRNWPKALEHADAALALDDRLAQAHNNRANALASLGRDAEAEAAFERALMLDPDNPDALYNQALQWLKQGRWAAAWPGFEARWRVRRMAPWRRDFQVPAWDGGEAPDKTLLIHAEQGMGDTMMMARYLPGVAARVGRLVLECAPQLVPLLAAMPGVGKDFDCVAAGMPLPPFDLHLPAMSLPGVFATTPDNVPWDGPYLRAPERPAVVSGTGLKVGLAWAGNPDNPTDMARSAPLADLAGILTAPGCSFHSLQYGPAGEQIAAASLDRRIADLGPRLGDFADTAAVVEELDLVISVCTAMVHLAGGLGRPLWVILPADADADWRWLRGRADTPWYPSARLFRQETAGNWRELAARVGGALAQYAASGRTA